MSQASATFPVSLSGTHLPIPPKPHFQDFQFKIIGKEPALLMRLSNNMSTQLDDLDMDDIYEEIPLPSSSTVATEKFPRDTCSRPTLFQTLAGYDEPGVTDTSHPSTSMNVVNSLSLPPSLQSISSIGASNIPKPNTTSPLPTSPSGRYRLWTSSVSPDPVPQSTACAVGSPANIQRPNRASSPHQSPIDLVLSPSDQDLKPADNFIALKKVVVLKDKFRAVSATARQSQRLAKHALMSAQRSAAAAQTCLAAAESFVPCVGDVISAIRRMRPGSVACGPASEWTAVLRDLEDDLYDLKQWSCRDTFGRALGQNLPHLQDIHFDGTTRESSSGFPLTSVEEEAQEAVRAWNQLDRQIHEKECPSGRSRLRREPGHQSDDRVSPESRVRRLGMEDDAENSQHQVIRESGTRVSKEASTGNLDKVRKGERSQAGGQQSVEAEPRGEVEENLPSEIATEAINAKDCRERQDSRDHQLHAQQQSAQGCEEIHHGPEFRGEGSVPVSMAASGDIASKKTPADGLQPQSALPRHDTPIGLIRADSIPRENSSMHNRAPCNLQTTLALPVINTEQAPTSKPVSSNGMLAEKRPIYPPSFSSALPNGISAAPRNGVDPTESTSASQAVPPTPIPTTFSDSEAVARSCGGLDKTLVPRQNSNRLRDVSCPSHIKTECMEPQLNFGVEGSRVVDDPLVPNEVKPPLNNPLKPDSDTFAITVPLSSSPDEREIGIKSPGRVSSVNLSAALPNGPPARNQKLPEAHIFPSAGPATSDSVKVIATRLTSHHVAHNDIVNNDMPAQPVLSNSQASPSSQLAPTPAVVPVHPPLSPSSVPLALRVETPTSYPNRDFDDSISPDLMFSHGWDVDGPRRGSRRSPNKSVPRSQSRDVESLNQYVHHGIRPVASHPRSHMPSLGNRLSKSPDGRGPMSPYDYSTPLIGKKRPRDEVNHPLPPRSRRDWTGAAFPSVSENQTSHVSQVDMSANPRLGPLTTPIPELGYNPNNSSHHPAPSLINRLDPSSESKVQVAHPPERRTQQHPPTQHKVWQTGGYNVGQASSSHRSNQNYDNGTPKLLNRMRSQEFQHGFDSGHSPNVGRTSNRSHGRGRNFGGQSGALQQQHSSRKQLSLYDRINPEY